MDKFYEWLSQKFVHPLSPLFFLLGAILILLGLSTDLNIPQLSKLAVEYEFRWPSIFIGITFMIISIFLYYKPPQGMILQNTKSNDHNDQLSFLELIKKLKTILNESGFTPDLIIGIARGGLPVSALLSKEFKDSIIPVVSLWPDNRFDNYFNDFRHSAARLGVDNIKNILIVDDICRSGRTLNEAKTYVKNSINNTNCDVRTAALSFYKDDHRTIAPEFYVERPEVKIRDLSGTID